MKYYTYGDEQINLIRHLVENPPAKIWWGYVFFVFDYNDYHLKLECESASAATQNEWDEAVITTFIKINSSFDNPEHAELVCENKTIDQVYIVRTFLYFTDYRQYSKPEKLFNRTIFKIKSFLTWRKDPVADLISKTTGGGQEFICHPNSEQAKKTNPDFANIIDVGLLIEIEGRFIRAFIDSNGYGFQIWDNKYFFNPDELKEDRGYYEFIRT